MLLVIFSQAILYDYHFIYLQNAVMSGCLAPQHGVSSGCRWRKGLQCERQLWIYWKCSRKQPTHGGPQVWGLGVVLTTPHCKIILCYEMFTQKASDQYW